MAVRYTVLPCRRLSLVHVQCTPAGESEQPTVGMKNMKVYRFNKGTYFFMAVGGGEGAKMNACCTDAGNI